mgnify:CR=1 FL=1
MPAINPTGPPLRTVRLHLTNFQETDVDAMAAMFADTEVRRHLAVGDFSAAGARRFAGEFVRQSRDELREAGYAALAVRAIDSDTALGYCGLRPLPDRISAAELVYALARPHWHQGLTREAVAAVLDWAHTLPGLREIVAMTRPDHTRSRAVMVASGMQYDGVSERYYGETLALYRLRLTAP